MIVAVDPAGDVELHDADEFGAFSVVVRGGGSAADVAAALGEGARTDGDDHVWIPATAVEALADGRTPEWRETFRAMLRAVERFGWYDREADTVKAHVDRHGNPY